MDGMMDGRIFHLFRADFRLEKPDFRLERADIMLRGADFRLQRGLSSGVTGLISGLRAGLRLLALVAGDRRMERWMDRITSTHVIFPCVLQDIGRLGPPPRKDCVCRLRLRDLEMT